MDTESRLDALERDMTQLKADLAVILSNYATKQDLANLREELRVEIHKEINALTWKMYGYGLVLVGAVHVLDRYGY
jgi:hypothetical protein